jgi:hypothetical protein
VKSPRRSRSALRLLLALVSIMVCAGSMAAAQTQDPAAAPSPSPPLRLDTWSLPLRGATPDVQVKAPRIETSGSGLCPSCSSDVMPPRGANDPWWIESRVRFDRPGGGFSAGVVGRRNAVLPLFASVPVGGGAYQPPMTSSSTANFETSNIDWSVIIGVRRRVLTTARGSTFDVVADGIIPVNPDQISRTSAPSAPSKSLRLGVTWRP